MHGLSTNYGRLILFTLLALVAGVDSTVAVGQTTTVDSTPAEAPSPPSVSTSGSNEKQSTQPEAPPKKIAPRNQGQQRFLLFAYCLLIVAASFCGGWLPFVVELTHTRMQMMVSLVGGLMLGIALFHLLPHAFLELGSLDLAVIWLMAGLLVMFFLIRTFHFHQHDVADLPGAPGGHGDEHDHDCSHHPHVHTQYKEAHSHPLSWIGVAIGLALHTLIDGLALGASIQAEARNETLLSLFGFGTFAAILLHKPLDAVSITSLMAAGGWSTRARHAVNGGFALMCPLGAILFFLGVERFSEHQHLLIGCALAFSAGVFLCISLGDLLPELEFHAHDRIKLSLMLLLGIALAYAIGFLEPNHIHAWRKSAAESIAVNSGSGESTP